MKNFLFSLITLTVVLTSCSDYGEKIKINDSLEVYVKGDSVTKSDGQKLGDYLADIWKEATNEKSVQLSKNSGAYEVRMPVDEEKLKKDSSLKMSFKAVEVLLELKVFPGSDVKFILTDQEFKDLKGY